MNNNQNINSHAPSKTAENLLNEEQVKGMFDDDEDDFTNYTSSPDYHQVNLMETQRSIIKGILDIGSVQNQKGQSQSFDSPENFDDE